jgi:site-specific recombinase XerD
VGNEAAVSKLTHPLTPSLLAGRGNYFAQDRSNQAQRLLKMIMIYQQNIQLIIGFNKRFITHLARRTFASILNEKGGNITAIQNMLGHSMITTTQRYISINRQFLKVDMGKLNSSLDNIF